MEASPTERKCPKCGAGMEAGFLRDRMQGGASRPEEWMQGVPETTWFAGLKLGSSIRFAVEAFRCEKCGFLEQYAVGPRKTGFL
ncbi:MAG: PF20097 family protein [Candidatus Angelobacter sp.]